ncbi:unnamed protein product [Clavelina lepadiformis]|uniref:Uncharacterized protein n=1 Tax=Clavelina lepadiformis TaxID=159417 RepID=A0ABP0GZP4_CLALP
MDVQVKSKFANSSTTVKEPPALNGSSNWAKKLSTESDGFGNSSKDNNMAALVFNLKIFQFTDNVTMHGLRYVFMKDISRLRRLIWILIVIAGMAYCNYLLSETLASYYTYPTIAKTRRKSEKKSEFPAVTFCNFNTFQKSKLTRQEQLAVETLYSGFPHYPNPRANLSDFEYVNITKFYYDKAFDYPNSLCVYKGKQCNSSHLSLTLTDLGVCVTFDPGSDPKDAYQTASGTYID